MRSAECAVLGNFTDEVTLLGVAGQITLGILDLDLPCDIRDIIADVKNLAETDRVRWNLIGMLAFDLIGLIPVIGVLKYSDETAESVASGEKILKESQTIYESFADLMSPDDAAKYLDFLENGSKEGLTGAELAGVEKADALLVSRKVEYEDVWDLRNAGDLLESGTSSLIDIDAIRPKLKTQPDTAFFWSGRTDGIGGAENAANIAKSRGGVTLESTIEIQNIVMPEWDFNNPSTMEAWDLASGAYAEQVSGEIRAVIGSELRPGNIWENVELPRLKNNPNVTKITTIDPKTGVENVV